MRSNCPAQHILLDLTIQITTGEEYKLWNDSRDFLQLWEVMDWIHLAQDTDWCRDVVNTVMNFWVP
jgi:hypothetical protein